MDFYLKICVFNYYTYVWIFFILFSYLEGRKELFNEDNYVRANKTLLSYPDNAKISSNHIQPDEKQSTDEEKPATFTNNISPNINAITTLAT